MTVRATGRAMVAGCAVALLLAGCATDKAGEKDLKTAQVEMDNGAPMAALELLRRHVQSHPEDVPTLLALGRANAQLGRYQPAILFFQDALDKDHNCVDALKGLARIDLQLNPAKALERLEDMSRRFPHDAQIWTDLGIARDFAGRHKAARDAYFQAMKLDPLLISAQSNLGLSYAISGRYDSARFMLQPLAASADATPKIRANLAYAQLMAGDEDAARRTLMHDMPRARANKVLQSYRVFGIQRDAARH